jgi:hypothetical protein
MSEIEVAWLAGLFDGEGTCFDTKRRNQRCAITMAVAMTNEEIIRRIQVVTGCGSVVLLRPNRPEQKESWRWQCYGANARNVLDQLFPWLIVKRERAALLIETHDYYFGEELSCR